VTLHTEPRLEETTFTLPHRTKKPQKTTAPDPNEFAQWSSQPYQTTGSPGNLPLWGGTRNSAVTSHTEPRLEETTFTLSHRTQTPQKTTAPDPNKYAHGSPQPY